MGINYRMLGVALEAHRKLMGKSVKEFITNDFGPICDRNTYNKVRAGLKLRDEIIYSDLMVNAGFTNKASGEIKYISEIWRFIDEYNVDQIENTLEEYFNLSIFGKQDIFNASYAKVLTIVYDYFIKRKRLKQKNVEFLMNCNELFNEETKNVILILLGYSIHECSEEIAQLLIQKIVGSNEASIVIRGLKWYISKCKYYDAAMLGVLIEKLIDKNNLCQYLDYLDAMTALTNFTDSSNNNFSDTFKELLLKHEDQIPVVKKVQYYGNACIMLLIFKKHEEALVMLKKIENIETKKKMTIYAYSIYCYSQLARNAPEYLYNLEPKDCYTKEDKILYTLMSNSNSMTNQEKRKYILAVIDDIHSDSIIYIMIFNNEMKRLCKEIGKYADYYKLQNLLEGKKTKFHVC